jgi:hypothetical protein
VLKLNEAASQKAHPRPRRWPSLAISLALHILFVLSLPFWASVLGEIEETLAASVQEAIESNERNKRLVWYKLPKLPSIRNATSQTARQSARGEKFSENEIVAEQQSATSSKQLIHRPDAQQESQQTEDLANMIARAAAPAPVPDRSEPVRKAPLPPETPRGAVETNFALDSPPTLDSSMSPLTLQAELTRLPRPPAKKFVPPESGQKSAGAARAMDLSGVPELQAASNAAVSPPGDMEIARLAKPAPRKFTPPASATSQRDSPARRLDPGTPPELDAGTGPGLPRSTQEISRLPKPPPRKFVPPAENPSGGTAGGAADFAGMPQLANGGGSSASTVQGSVAAGIPKLARRKFVAPGNSSGTGPRPTASSLPEPPNLQAGSGKGGGTALQDAAVISLKPGSALAPPDTKLGGKFSQGREVGPPAHVSNADPNAVSIPGVSSRPSPLDRSGVRLGAPAHVSGNETTEEYFEVKLDLTRQWPKLSVPLSPSSRTLPRRIDPYFRNRSVFTVVVPMTGLERYAGDWIIWFSPKLDGEGAALPLGQNIKMETPLPFWKLENRRWLVGKGETGVEQRVQMIVEINRDGRVRVKELLSRFGLAMNQMVTNDVTRWVFQPARRDGLAIDVDAVLEIPFRTPPGLNPVP